MSTGKDRQLRHWDAVARGWGAWFDWTVANFAPVTEWFNARGVWRSGACVLDVACGSGYPALVAAARVGPNGRVVASDISLEMLAVARRRADDQALTNIAFAEEDAAHLQHGDRSFDAVTHAYGLMFCDNPQHALSEARRVLKPGGRLALATWDQPSKSPFFSVIGTVASAVLAFPQPVPGQPGPFRFAMPATLEALMRAAGFEDVIVESVPMTCELASAEAYLQVFRDLAWKSRIESLSDADWNRFRNAVAEAVRPYEHGGRLRLVATSLCAGGTKAVGG